MKILNKPDCVNHKGREGANKILVENGSILDVCDPCRDKILTQGRIRYVCKHCSVAVKSETDTTAIRMHKFGCPRRRGEEEE